MHEQISLANVARAGAPRSAGRNAALNRLSSAISVQTPPTRRGAVAADSCSQVGAGPSALPDHSPHFQPLCSAHLLHYYPQPSLFSLRPPPASHSHPQADEGLAWVVNEEPAAGLLHLSALRPTRPSAPGRGPPPRSRCSPMGSGPASSFLLRDLDP